MRPNHREQPRDDGRHALEVIGPHRPLHAFSFLADLDMAAEICVKHLARRRREQDVDASLTADLGVCLEVARVGGEVLRGAKLQRVDEDGRDHPIALGPRGPHQADVPLVQATHGRHQADDAIPSQPLSRLGGQDIDRIDQQRPSRRRPWLEVDAKLA